MCCLLVPVTVFRIPGPLFRIPGKGKLADCDVRWLPQRPDQRYCRRGIRYVDMHPPTITGLSGGFVVVWMVTCIANLAHDDGITHLVQALAQHGRVQGRKADGTHHFDAVVGRHLLVDVRILQLVAVEAIQELILQFFAEHCGAETVQHQQHTYTAGVNHMRRL